MKFHETEQDRQRYREWFKSEHERLMREVERRRTGEYIVGPYQERHVWPMETPDVIAARVSFFDRLHGPQDFPDDVTTWSEWAD